MQKKGGQSAVINGQKFEKKTDNIPYLKKSGFIKKKIPNCERKYNWYFKRKQKNKSIIYLTQSSLRFYFNKFKINVFRNPDEAYLVIRYQNRIPFYVLKILEKKFQKSSSSIDTKLLAGIGFIEEYQECFGLRFQIEYAFCLNDFLKKEYESDKSRFQILNKINKKHSIRVFFGDDPNYFELLNNWINE